MNRLLLTFIFLITNLIAHGQSLSDTLDVKPNSVIFYSLTQTEFDSLSKNDKDGGLNEVIADFDYYVGKLLPILEKDTTKYVLYTAHRYFRISNENGSYFFDRVEQKNIVGIILNRKSEYETSRGIGTDVDMMQTINDFFNKE